MEYAQKKNSMTYAEAVGSALKGDQNAFRFLYESTCRDKFYMARQYMKNDEDAADVLQESYLKAWQRLSSLTDAEKFPSWLSSIVAHTALDALKKKQPVLFSELEKESAEGESFEYEEIDLRAEYQPERAFTEQETSFLLKEMIDALSDEQRMCVLMHYVEEIGVQEIADTANCSRGTVLSRLHYGRQNLRAKAEELQQKGYDLLGISGVALLYRLLKGGMRAAETAEESAVVLRDVSEAVLTAAGLSSATATAAAAAGNAASRMRVKIAAAVIGIAVIGAGGYALTRGNASAPPDAAGTSAVSASEEVTVSAGAADASDATGADDSSSLQTSEADDSAAVQTSEADDAATAVTLIPPEADEEEHEGIEDAFATEEEVLAAHALLDQEVLDRFDELLASVGEKSYYEWIWFDDDAFPDLVIADMDNVPGPGMTQFHLYHGDSAEHLMARKPQNPEETGLYTFNEYLAGYGPVSYFANGYKIYPGATHYFVPRQGMEYDVEYHEDEGEMQILIAEMQDGFFNLTTVLQRNEYRVEGPANQPKRVPLPEGEYLYYLMEIRADGISQIEITEEEYLQLSAVGNVIRFARK